MMPIYEIRSIDGSRVEVRQTPSRNYALVCFPAGCAEPTRGRANFLSAEEAASEGLEWVQCALADEYERAAEAVAREGVGRSSLAVSAYTRMLIDSDPDHFEEDVRRYSYAASIKRHGSDEESSAAK